MNLVELDAPAAPKRTCSLPNLAWNSTQASSIIPRQNHRDTLLFFQQHAASTLSRGALRGLSRPALCLRCTQRRRRFCGWVRGRALSPRLSVVMCGVSQHKVATS